jgi:protein-disulfide isomerase
LGGIFVNRAIIAAIAVVALLVSAYVLTRGTHSASADRGAEASGAAAPVSVPPADPAPATSTSSSSSTPANASASSSAETGPMMPAAPAGKPLPVPQALAGIPDLDPHEAVGSKSAPIVMEVFSDYQCPACKVLYTTTNRLLMDNYVSTGKVYLIHRDFPLPMHAHSKVAAQYSRAASQIGKLEPVADALFQNQEKWEQSGDVDGTVAAVLSSSEMTKVRALVKAGTVDAAIEKDKALGQTYRVNQTPTTVFHSKGQTFPYAGIMSWDILKQFLDQLLSQK